VCSLAAVLEESTGTEWIESTSIIDGVKFSSEEAGVKF